MKIVYSNIGVIPIDADRFVNDVDAGSIVLFKGDKLVACFVTKNVIGVANKEVTE